MILGFFSIDLFQGYCYAMVNLIENIGKIMNVKEICHIMFLTFMKTSVPLKTYYDYKTEHSVSPL